MTAAVRTRLDELLARQDVVDLLVRFGRALDDHDWDAYRNCLTPTVRVDYGEATGLPAVDADADEWTRFVRACVEPQLTVHYYTNFVVTFPSGDRATCRLNHMSCHRMDTRSGASTYVQFGTYEAGLVHKEEWRISSLRHRLRWAEGNPSLVDTSRDAWRAAAARVFGERVG